MLIIAVTAAPINTGANSLLGRPTLHFSVKEKITKTNKKVPNASARNALNKEIEGKYSPNIMAVAVELASPRIILLANSKLTMEFEKSK